MSGHVHHAPTLGLEPETGRHHKRQARKFRMNPCWGAVDLLLFSWSVNVADSKPKVQDFLGWWVQVCVKKASRTKMDAIMRTIDVG